MQKNFVVFLSPGTFVSEVSMRKIEDWDVDKAVEMSKQITERYGSKPYGFYFITKERKENELDSKIIKRSNMYYINGVMRTLKELIKENNSENRILISNMKCNGWNKVVTTYTPYKYTQPLQEGDIVLTI